MQVSYPDFLRSNANWLAAGFMLTFASSFGQTFFISVFAGEIRGAFGLTHGQWGTIYTLATTGSAAVMIWVGALTDRLRARTLGITVLAGLAAACVLMSQITALWALVGTIFLLRLMGQGMLGHVAMVSMARWFVATRGRAIGVAGLGVALGEAALPVAFVAAMGFVDWRYLWVVAAVALCALIPVLARLLRRERTPQAMSAGSESVGMQGRHWRRGEVLRHWLFWLMAPALIGIAAFNTAIFFHQVHLSEIKGWSHVQLVALFPVFTAVSVVSLVASGWAVDRFGTGRLMRFYLLPLAAGYVVLAMADSPLGAALAFLAMGLTQGAHATLSSAIWATYFGTRHLGAIRALASAAMVLGTALGPGITGVLIDAGIGFEAQLVAMAGYFLVAAGCAALAAVRADRLAAASASAAGKIDVIGP